MLWDLEHILIQIRVWYLYSYATLGPSSVIANNLSTIATARTAHISRDWEYNTITTLDACHFLSINQWASSNMKFSGISIIRQMSQNSGGLPTRLDFPDSGERCATSHDIQIMASAKGCKFNQLLPFFLCQLHDESTDHHVSLERVPLTASRASSHERVSSNTILLTFLPSSPSFSIGRNLAPSANPALHERPKCKAR